ncbi:MAG: serine/threonine protein kinase, partial [Acidobacteriota bacterium]|nr:serine/threonine protein kinase [Acidobacteriota bacterium]
RSLVRPIRELVRAQRRLAGQEEAPGVAGAGGPGEIAQLQSSFAALERGLRDREALDRVLLGRYQVLDLLGVGAMGSVFRGYDPKLERPVALKTIRIGEELEQEEKRRRIGQLLREAVTVARFSDPHIVSIYDLDDTPEAAFIAMELVEGVSLETLLTLEGRLGPDLVIPLGAAIASALTAAHRRTVVHRDVKPANVLLGYNGAVKVTDFGISELVTLTRQDGGLIFGTPGYLPPEILLGGPYECVGDLFALGATLYFCLTGERPFDGTHQLEIIRKTVFSPVVPPSRMGVEVPEALERLVLNLLEKDPAKRVAEAGLVAAELGEMSRERDLRWAMPSTGRGRRLEEIRPAAHAQWLSTTRLRPTGVAHRLLDRLRGGWGGGEEEDGEIDLELEMGTEGVGGKDPGATPSR